MTYIRAISIPAPRHAYVRTTRDVRSDKRLMIRRRVDQIFRRHMVFSFMICACWSMWAPQSRLVYLAVAQSTGSSTWGGRKPALQLQHDAGLILSNVQVLQQLVTALNGASSGVMPAVCGRQPLPTDAMQHVMPCYRVRRAAHYMTAMGLWRPPVAPEIRGPLPVATCNACMSCSECFPDVPQLD